MSEAKYYIYRNLHKRCFSVRYKGRVIKHLWTFVLPEGGTFKVNEKSRQRVIQDKAKNVHAFIVTDNEPQGLSVTQGIQMSFDRFQYPPEEDKLVYYNPYRQDHFSWQGKPIYKTTRPIVGLVDRVFTWSEETL